MKRCLKNYLPLTLALAILATAIISNPPGNAPWEAIFHAPVPLGQKLALLTDIYLLPALLSFAATTLLQLQFRLSATGISTGSTFAICMFASLTLVLSFRYAAIGPAAMPSYALGMALSYTVLSRLYAVRMKRLWGRISVPRIIWRGNTEQIAELHREMESRQQNRSAGRAV